jgi:hypothetical protein
MLSDTTNRILKQLAERMYAAEFHTFRLAEQIRWHIKHDNWVEIIVLTKAFQDFRNQFGPWMIEHLNLIMDAELRRAWPNHHTLTN